MQRYSIDYESYTTETDGEWCQWSDAEKIIAERDEALRRLAEAVKYLRQAHREFTPNVTNSLALSFIEREERIAQRGDDK